MARIETTTPRARGRNELKNNSMRNMSSYSVWNLAEVRIITRFTLLGTVERENCAASKKSTYRNLPTGQRPCGVFRKQNWRAFKIIELI